MFYLLSSRTKEDGRHADRNYLINDSNPFQEAAAEDKVDKTPTMLESKYTCVPFAQSPVSTTVAEFQGSNEPLLYFD